MDVDIDLIDPTVPLFRFNNPNGGGLIDPNNPPAWVPTGQWPTVHIPNDGWTAWDECKWWYNAITNTAENCLEHFPFYP
jgi:hypothetical protein